MARDTARPDPVRPIALVLGSLGFVALSVINASYAIRDPLASDFAGFYTVLRAHLDHLGCVYVRSVQFAGARMVPDIANLAKLHYLAWHFNEPLVLTWLAYPLVHLPLPHAVWAWQCISGAALAGAGVMLWRQRGSLAPLLAFGVIAALLCNDIANTNFWLAQDDSILLLVFLCGLALLRGGHDISAGLLFGVAALKPQVVFLVFAVLVFQRRWRVAAAMAGCAGFLWALSVAMVGPACAVTWLHTASKIGELQVAIGLPMTLARLTHAVFPAEVLFAVLALAALALLWRLRHLETELAIAVALGLALVIGLHVLGYDMLFLAPLGMLAAQRFPWQVLATGWLFTFAQLIDQATRWAFNNTTPVRMAEVAPLAAVAGSLLVLRQLANAGQQGGGAALAAPVPGHRGQQNLLLPQGAVPLQQSPRQPRGSGQQTASREHQAARR